MALSRLSVLVLTTVINLVSTHTEHKHDKHEKLPDLFGLTDMIQHFASLLDESNVRKGDRTFLKFQLIDSNDDKHLDGIELMKFWIQEHADFNETIPLSEYEEMTDDTLHDSDVDDDGYVSFHEFSEYNKKYGSINGESE